MSSSLVNPLSSMAQSEFSQIDRFIQDFQPTLRIQSPKSPEDLYQAGWEAMRRNQRALACDLFNQAIEAKPDVPNYYYARSFAHEGLDLLPRALEDIDRAISLNSNRPYLFLSLTKVTHLYLRRMHLLMKAPRTNWSISHLTEMMRYVISLEPSLETNLPQARDGWDSLNSSSTASPIAPSWSSGIDTPPRSFQKSSIIMGRVTAPPARRCLEQSFLNLSVEDNESSQSSMSTPPRTQVHQIRGRTLNMMPSPSNLMLPKNGNPQEITNPLGLKALFVRNVNRNVKDIEVRVVFERFGSVIKFKHFNEKSRSAFVCFGSAEVATRAMKTLYYFSDQRLCHDPAIPWMFRFAPTDDQRDEPSLKSPQVMRQTVERCGECYDWRVGERCQRSPCPFIHIPINRNIDSKTTDAQAKRQR